jgi:hypothetical protein
VPREQLREHELGAHAVGARDEHRLAHAGELRREQAAEAADVA